MAAAATARPTPCQTRVSGAKKPTTSAAMASASARPRRLRLPLSGVWVWSSCGPSCEPTPASPASPDPPVVSAIGCGSKPLLRMAASACSMAGGGASRASVRCPRLKLSERMPAMPCSARRISDSSTAQSIVATLKRTLSGLASRGRRTRATGMTTGAATGVRAGAQQASSAQLAAGVSAVVRVGFKWASSNRDCGH